MYLQTVYTNSMNLDELNRLVGLGEGLTLEFKTKVPRPERIAKEVIAFANTRGGRLLLGVDDDGTVKGVRDSAEEEFALNEALQNHCTPPLKVQIRRIQISKKRDVILVQVPESEHKPHYLTGPNEQATRTAYVRVEDMSVEASKEHIRILKARKSPGNVLFEFGDKEHALMRYLEKYGRITVEQFAKLCGTNKRKASQTLVLLTKAEILRLHPDPQTDYFTLAYDLG